MSAVLRNLSARVVAVQRGNPSLGLDSRLANLMRLMRLWMAKSKAFRLLRLNSQKRIKIHKDL